MRKFSEWLDKHYERDAVFSEEIGAYPTMVSKWRLGKVIPSLEWMVDIEDFTKGKIKISDWVRWAVSKKREARKEKMRVEKPREFALTFPKEKSQRRA